MSERGLAQNITLCDCSSCDARAGEFHRENCVQRVYASIVEARRQEGLDIERRKAVALEKISESLTKLEAMGHAPIIARTGS